MTETLKALTTNRQAIALDGELRVAGVFMYDILDLGRRVEMIGYRLTGEELRSYHANGVGITGALADLLRKVKSGVGMPCRVAVNRPETGLGRAPAQKTTQSMDTTLYAPISDPRAKSDTDETPAIENGDNWEVF